MNGNQQSNINQPPQPKSPYQKEYDLIKKRKVRGGRWFCIGLILAILLLMAWSMTVFVVHYGTPVARPRKAP